MLVDAALAQADSGIWSWIVSLPPMSWNFNNQPYFHFPVQNRFPGYAIYATTCWIPYGILMGLNSWHNQKGHKNPALALTHAETSIEAIVKIQHSWQFGVHHVRLNSPRNNLPDHRVEPPGVESPRFCDQLHWAWELASNRLTKRMCHALKVAVFKSPPNVQHVHIKSKCFTFFTDTLTVLDHLGESIWI